METLSTNAEKLAERAESFAAFGGLKLLHIKQQLALLLSMIGRDGIFDDYTHHEISHINKMLEMLDWLVPEQTKDLMTPTDWLLTVLAIYFHDLGMLVTKREYEKRDDSGFPEFRDRDLFGGETGQDYRAKVEKLGADKIERFAYQEFVRHKHAERIHAWITGREREHLGISVEVISELDNLLGSLSDQFRRDLAAICESHHLNDLDNLKKYKTSQPYGDSDGETGNVQYSAILMRTADLLHITSDRTPSISYRLINPSDPLSQEEWAKQMAVRRVRPQVGRDRDGIPNETAPRDTIEVHADFKKVDGFFGLTSYLQYVRGQLEKSYEWATEANKTTGVKHRFPWRYIDDTHIETEGFIKETFEFSFDQEKILDLLTGHTLYNDIKIVLRELVQNSIDAVRLQYCIDVRSDPAATMGKVGIHWNSKSRTLCVEDNGTGMSQQIIERNLLKVGASRYQGEDFKNEFPSFSSISRFGIGILSTFMIADSVEIVTCHPDDDRARELSLRSVHGKYLIRLLDKYNDLAPNLAPHGTKIVLRVRSSTDMQDVVDTAKRWIVLPKCEVTLSIDDNEPIAIGFTSLKDAVAAHLVEAGTLVDRTETETERVKIIEDTEDGVTLAYAVRWSEYFKEWSFFGMYSDSDAIPLLGTCVEGIRVEFNTPGFEGFNIVAAANAEGTTAPKTNVARSGLEVTPERDRMLGAIYSMLSKHVRREMEELYSKRSFSLSWAAQESRYLLAPLISPKRGGRAQNTKLLMDKVAGLPLFLVEQNGKRQAVSASSLNEETAFWTIDGASVGAAENLIREMPGNASLSILVNTFDSELFQIPDEPVLCGAQPESIRDALAFTGKEVVEIRVNREQRRIDLRWAAKTMPPRWRLFPRSIDYRQLARLMRGREGPNVSSLSLGEGNVVVDGISNEIAVRAFRRSYLLPQTPIASFLLGWLNRLEGPMDPTIQAHTTYMLFDIVLSFLETRFRIPVNMDIITRYTGSMSEFVLPEAISAEFVDILNSTNWKVFDPLAWVRSVNPEG